MESFKMLHFLVIWIVLDLDLTNSAPDECPLERERLQAQLKSLEVRAVKQQEMIQRLTNLSMQKQNPVNESIFFDLGERQYTDCAQVFSNGNKASGFYLIKPMSSPAQIRVYCDMTEGGGWTVLQRRTDGSQSFDRDWKDYKVGFGDLKSASGEFWIGNDNLHYLTSQGENILRINLEDFEGSHRFAVYGKFKVDGEENHYQLQIGRYTGNAGDALSGNYNPGAQSWASHHGMKFSTRDKDNDHYDRNCAREDKAGWWFNKCHTANLNGIYYKGPYSAVTDNGIVWYPWHGWWYSLKSVEMKIRPAGFELNED
ncbi:fibrinogen-like protein 1 [Astyanax mexicanus]|uniref:fibrinogen-like protein 1 n=1 Tax=Astyanax mexicanus TaxID=7994 RepID=UPI0020CAB6E8|nr:fibrinogen-like protein 1 [Astyanax mexicanus]